MYDPTSVARAAAEAAEALKSVARDQALKAMVMDSQELYPLLLRAARRYVCGEEREDALATARELSARGYLVSLEFIGENTHSADECRRTTDEFLDLIAACHLPDSTISLDLSHVGLSVDSALAASHLTELAAAAAKRGHTIMISMEESSKTDRILDTYRKVTGRFANVGITIQAHLYRSDEDVRALLNYPGRIRLVKGAYQEPPDVAIPRGSELDRRYLEFVAHVVEAGHPVSIATHDERIIDELKRRGYLGMPSVMVEMLYGIRPDLLRRLRADGIKTQVYLTYGREWYLYLCHRLAEYPPNIYTAVADIVDPRRTETVPY
ncbi:MAG TPA: proline dehydrogenase family protein [Limnochordia bacterium]